MPVFEITSTPEEKAAEAMRRMFKRANSTINMLTTNWKREFREFWFSPDYTPQQAADALGVLALDVFVKSAATKNLILMLDPSALDDPEIDYTSTPLTVTPEVIDGQQTGRVIIG